MQNYKKTLHLPKTSFQMRANLPQREPNILKQWQSMDLYQALRDQSVGKPAYILHDGPPYANGDIHMGHVINKALKDVIVKSRQMMGFDANYVPGWDCHGLPIELKVEQDLNKNNKSKESLPLSAFRNRCRTFAARWIKRQSKAFQRLGIIGDWKTPYLTMDFRFEADTVRALWKLLENGSVYKGFKPVFWCPHDITALAEAEIEYQDHRSTAITVKFPLAPDESLTEVMPDIHGSDWTVSLLIWTTTPWTIPANLAVSLNGDFIYVVFHSLQSKDLFIVAEGLLEETLQSIGLDRLRIEIVARFPGRELERKRFRHPYLDQNAPVLLGEHVTLEAGTGCVHTAPGHGQEDYEIGLRYGLIPFNPVDDRGCFVAGTPYVAGLFVSQANETVMMLLEERGMLLARSELTHSYPHCWRCHQPLIMRATPQWFVSMEHQQLRQKALSAIRKTHWIPAWGEERIYTMVANRPDWCLSRQRAWGVPLTIISCQQCETVVVDDRVLANIVQAVEAKGTDVWFERDVADFLPESFSCGACGSVRFRKEMDILDVWFDSGVTHKAVLERREDLSLPADLYLEGSDQHRGWFHSSLLTSVGMTQESTAPYRAVLTHGFVVDGAGRKMSKSLGNVISPDKIIQDFGVDILRLWVTAEDYAGDIRLSDEILKGLADAYRRIRNTIRFLLGNLAGFNPERDRKDHAGMPALDRWALDRLAHLIDTVTDAYETYTFHRVYQALHSFCSVEMGAFYLDIIKDRLYCDGAQTSQRLSAQTVLWHILNALVRLMAPILSFTAEEIWQHLSAIDANTQRPSSVHLAAFPKREPAWRDQNLFEKWEKLREIRAETYRLLEQARTEKQIGSFLDAEVTLSLDVDEMDFMNQFDELHKVFIVSRVTLSALSEASDTGREILIEPSRAEKCVRCWNRDPRVGASSDHPELCPRCYDVVSRQSS